MMLLLRSRVRPLWLLPSAPPPSPSPPLDANQLSQPQPHPNMQKYPLRGKVLEDGVFHGGHKGAVEPKSHRPLTAGKMRRANAQVAAGGGGNARFWAGFSCF